MVRFILLTTTLFFCFACSPQFNGATPKAPELTAASQNASSSTIGMDLINRIKLLQNINVMGMNEQARVQVMLPDGSFSNVRPLFTLNGVNYATDFARVYREVIAGNAVLSVTKFTGGLPAPGNTEKPVTIAIKTLQ